MPITFNKIISGLIRLIRWPNLLILLAAQAGTAVFLAFPEKKVWTVITDGGLLKILAGTLWIAAAGYIVNDYFDQDTDKANKPEKVIIGKWITEDMAWYFYLAFTATGVLILYRTSWELGTLGMITAFLLWLYSYRLKKKPLLGNLMVSALTALSLVIIWFYVKTNTAVIMAYSLFAFFINLIRELVKDMEDKYGDEKTGCKTLPVIWGITKTKILTGAISVIFIFIMIFIAVFSGWWVLIIYLSVISVGMILFIFMLVKSHTSIQFGKLSLMNKWMMVAGLLSMFFFKLHYLWGIR